MHAIYHDTVDGRLGQAGLSLRVRLQNGRWTQTLKAPGPNALSRMEDEVLLDPPSGALDVPAAELSRHKAQAARHAISAVLGERGLDSPPRLVPQFQVTVKRRTRMVRHGRSTIAVALDEGELLAAGRKQPVRELELELHEGDIRDLVAVARRWRTRWGLWINTESKAARGNRLAAGELYGKPAPAERLEVSTKAPLGELTAAILDSCLRQVMINASAIAAGSRADEHVHQLRVGLRRLRTALRELPSLEREFQHLEAVLTPVFRQLGGVRDRGYVLRTIQPLVEAAGGPALRIPSGFHDDVDPGELVRSGPFQDAILALLSRAEEVRRMPGPRARKLLVQRSARLHKQVARDGRRFTRLAPEHQHRVRKRLKRLRYLSEFAEAVYPKRRVRTYIKALKPMQDVLGQFNDELMAQRMYEELVGRDPGARFGADWLKERQAGEAKACRRALRRLSKVRPFWKGDYA